MRKIFSFLLILALVCVFAYPAKAGTNDRFSDIALGDSGDSRNAILIPERTAPTGDPPSNWGWLYVKDNGGTSVLYFEDDAGGVTSWGGSTAWDDLVDPDLDSTIDFTTYTAMFTSAVITDYSFTMENTGVFNAGEGVLKLEQKTGNPDGGDLLYATMADPDINGIRIYHSGDPAAGAMLELDQAADDDAQAIFIRAKDNAVGDTVFQVGQGGDVTISETTLINEAMLDFSAGAGEINTATASALTLSADNGGDAGEDLIVIANNISITAEGLVTIPADGALDIAIDLTDVQIDHAISIGANTILMTTGDLEGGAASIGFTDFTVTADGLITTSPDAGSGTGIDITPSAALDIGVDLSDANIVAALDIGANTIISTGGVFAVTAAGDITANDITAGGTITGLAIAQDNIVSVTGGASLGLDGNAGGGVSIATQSGTGTIEVGGGGFGTLMELNQNVNLTLVGGQLSITDNSDADVVTILNNTITTQELINASSASMTTGIGMRIDLPAATDATNLYLTNVDATMTATGNYIYAHDGTDDVFSVKRHGSTYIMGPGSGTAAISIDAGDIEIVAGHVEVTTGNITTATGNVTITTNGDIALTRGGIQVDSVDPDNSHIKRDDDTTTAPLLELEATNVNDDQTVLLIDNNITGSAELSLEITSDSTGPTISSTVTSATGDGILFDVPASSTGQLIKADLAAWLGTIGEGGIIDIVTTAAGTAEVGQGIRLDFRGTGTAGTAVQGKGLHVHSNAALKADESLIYLDNLTNWAIHMNPNGAAADGIGYDVPASYAGQGIVADLATWIGTTSEGFIDITTDAGNADTVGSIIRINMQDDDVDSAATSGKGIYIKEVSPFKDGTFIAHFESTSNGSFVAIGEADISAAPLLGASPIALEGNTRDGTNIVSLSVTDPTTAKSFNIPDSNVNMEAIGNIMVGLTEYTESAVAIESIVESEVAVAASHAAAGQVYTWEIAGVKTGGNNTYAILLDLDGTTALTLTASSVVAAHFVCRITCIMVDSGNQLVYGELLESGKSPVVVRASNVDNLAGAVNIGLEMSLANAGDEIKVYNTIVTYNE